MFFLEKAPVEADDAMGAQSEEAVTLSWEEYQRMTNLFVMKIRYFFSIRDLKSTRI